MISWFTTVKLKREVNEDSLLFSLKRIFVTMSETPGRPMKYPYTLTAKIAQFPLKYYLQNQWIWRYWFIGIAVATPIIYKIHKMANSPENVAKWAEIKRKEAAEHH